MTNILSKPVTYFRDLINKGHSRSVRAKKNILLSFFIKGGSIAVSIVSVPITLHYVNPDQYGIWLTLTSLLSWFGFFDIGLGNGMRNKFAEAKAKGDHEQARIYVSTTYAILSIISLSLLIIFLCINPFLDWATLLNAPRNMSQELGVLAVIVLGYFCINFVLLLIGTILNADQRPAIASSFNFIASLLSLIITYILTKTTSGSLIYLGISFVSTQLLVLLVSSIWFFSGKYKRYAPSLKYVRMKYARNLMNLGAKFFLIQISFLIIYETTVIIIAQMFTPAAVTPYNIAFKYFSVIPMVFGIITMPYWSACTEAYVNKDFDWIRASMRKLVMIWAGFVAIALVMLVFAERVYLLWVGPTVHVPFLLSAIIVVYVIANAWCTIFSSFINGIGKIRLQLYSGIIGAIINIPLAIFLADRVGIAGVVLSSCVLAIGGAIWVPIQYYKLINNKATGIWNR